MLIFIEEIGAGNAPSTGAILDEVSKQHQHKQFQICAFLVHIRCKFNAQFG